MFTLTSSSKTRLNESRIAVPDDMSPQDHERLAGLGEIFYAHVTPDRRTFIMTEKRGGTCWLLFKHGFAAMPRTRKGDNYCITHPLDGRRYELAEAVACARLMEPEERK